MVFSSPEFLFIFLPASLLLYFAMPTLRLKNLVLTVLSLVFYACGEPIWVVLLLISSFLDYTVGRVIERYRGSLPAKAAIYASVIINLGLLAAFKYTNFFVDNINALTGLSLAHTTVTLPVGISFYTFQTLSYSLDVYKGNVKVQRSFMDFLLFVSLFPQLVAGPIVRYADIAEQISVRKHTIENAVYGSVRFFIGLGKKVLIANYASGVVDRMLVDNGGIAAASVTGAWLGIIMYAFFIYFDFSGYSDMAIGLGRIFGFSYPENFKHPYISRSVSEFWRRWHISLGSFFRDYVYIPLGGNRVTPPRWVWNMLVVWGLTGLWHGASWNFVIWGLWFFVLLVAERVVGKERLQRIPTLLRVLGTFLAVLVGWVFFYFTNMGDAFYALGAMLGLQGSPLIDDASRLALVNSIPLLAVCIIGATPLLAMIGNKVKEAVAKDIIPQAAYAIPTALFGVIVLALCTVSLIGGTSNPFIYFRF